jgi:hypothetical protein
MPRISASRQEKYFLIIAAIGLTPIALSYGLVPGISLMYLFDMDATGTSAKHIFRAVMVLYFGMSVLWCWGAFKPQLREPALYSLVFFMLGLASGRILSILIDGLPNGLLITYLVLELVMGFIGLRVLQKRNSIMDVP